MNENQSSVSVTQAPRLPLEGTHGRSLETTRDLFRRKPLPNSAVAHAAVAEMIDDPDVAAANGLLAGSLWDAHQPGASRFHSFFDLCLIWISGGAAYLLATMSPAIATKVSHAGFFLPQLAGFLLMLSVMTVWFATMRGSHGFSGQKTASAEVKSLAVYLVFAAVVAGSCAYLWGMKGAFDEVAALTVILSWASLSGWRMLAQSRAIPALAETRNVLIVGNRANGRLLRDYFRQNPGLGYAVEGILEKRKAVWYLERGRDSVEIEALKGDAEELAYLTRANFIDEIFIAGPIEGNLAEEVLWHARAAGLQARVVPDLCGGVALGLLVEYIGRFPTITLHRCPAPTTQLIVKRLADVVVSAAALALLLPFLAVVAILVKLDSQGPVFYASRRVGKKGKAFFCYKFRTMVENADALKGSLHHLNERDGILFKIAADPRITRIGQFLRKFSVDELPQLWNVLKGDMSLVGPSMRAQ